MRFSGLLFWVCFNVFLFSSSCSSDKDQSNVVQPAREELNVAYGNAPLQKMDVYFPRGYNEYTPVVFVIHGGGFIAGTKEDFTTQAKLFRDQGFVTVNISHRLVDTTGLQTMPMVHMPSAVKVSDELADVHSAVEKYQSMAESWNVGTARMYIAGHSAGAILALLYLQGDYNDDKHIRAGANWAGLTDLSIPHDSLLQDLDPRYIEVLYRATGVMPSTANNLYYMAISPYWVANISPGMPAISIFPSENNILNIPDEVAFNLHRTQTFHNLLTNRGIPNKLSIYEGSDHGFGNKPGAWEQLIRETAAFFNEH